MQQHHQNFSNTFHDIQIRLADFLSSGGTSGFSSSASFASFLSLPLPRLPLFSLLFLSLFLFFFSSFLLFLSFFSFFFSPLPLFSFLLQRYFLANFLRANVYLDLGNQDRYFVVLGFRDAAAEFASLQTHLTRIRDKLTKDYQRDGHNAAARGIVSIATGLGGVTLGLARALGCLSGDEIALVGGNPWGSLGLFLATSVVGGFFASIVYLERHRKASEKLEGLKNGE